MVVSDALNIIQMVRHRNAQSEDQVIRSIRDKVAEKELRVAWRSRRTPEVRAAHRAARAAMRVSLEAEEEGMDEEK